MIPGEMKKKVCLVGDPAVGKTSTIRRFVYSEFDEKYISTMGASISKKQFLVPFNAGGGEVSVKMTLSIWDLIGQKSFRALTSRHFQNSDGALLVADGTNKESLWSLREWLSSLFNTAGPVPVVFLINKRDLMVEGGADTVTEADIAQVAAQHQIPHLYTSARTGENIEEAFTTLSEALIRTSVKLDVVSTPEQVCGEILESFINLHGGPEAGGPIARHQFKKAGVDIAKPTKEGLQAAIRSLLAVTERLKGPQMAGIERQKYMRLMRRLP
jgi:small GTP-binding protein